MRRAATAPMATTARRGSTAHHVAWTSSSPTTSVTVRVQNTAMTSSELPWDETPEAVTETIGSVTVESSQELAWNSVVAGGLRFRYSTAPGVFLVGYGTHRRLPFEDVLDGLRCFASPWVQPDELRFAPLPHHPFPVLLGWEHGPDVTVEFATNATDTPCGHIAEAQVRHYWSGWSPQERIAAGRATAVRTIRGLREGLVDLFTETRDEQFEFGAHAEFDTRLVRLLASQQKGGLDTLLEMLMDSDIPSSEAASRAVMVVARSSEVGASSERLHFLTAVLGHRHASMRDSAALGLFDLGSIDALAPLRDALSTERSPDIRRSLAEVISALEHRSS